MSSPVAPNAALAAATSALSKSAPVRLFWSVTSASSQRSSRDHFRQGQTNLTGGTKLFHPG